MGLYPSGPKGPIGIRPNWALRGAIWPVKAQSSEPYSVKQASLPGLFSELKAQWFHWALGLLAILRSLGYLNLSEPNNLNI